MMQDWYYFVASIVAVASCAIWIIGKLSAVEIKLKSAIIHANDKILEKMDYHERHDDNRFGDIQNQLMELRIINARNGLNGHGSKSIHRSSED